MKDVLINQLVQFILSVIGVVSTYAIAKLGQYLQAKQQEVVAKKGAYNYNYALNIAKGMYYVLESEFKDVEKSGMQKKAEMDNRLLTVIPQLTQDELDSINKQIWNEFNKDVITPILVEQK